ncbi:MAG: hypothetical protein KAV44_05485 [Bacteroidales bacterium]|nr:hypothetical protein [Bacteroidales bacterium]
MNDRKLNKWIFVRKYVNGRYRTEKMRNWAFNSEPFNKMNIDKANFIQIQFYYFKRPFQLFSSWWSSLNTDQKIRIIAITIGSIISIITIYVIWIKN